MRLTILKSAFGVYLVIIILVLVKLQIFNGEKYYQLSENNRIRLRPLEAPRGRIYDRNGRILADNYLSFEVKVIPHMLGGEYSRALFNRKSRESLQRLHRERNLKRLAEILGIPLPTLKEKVDRAEADSSYLAHEIAREIAKEKAIAIMEEGPEGLPGVFVEARPRRFYPYGRAACHVLGYLGKPTREEYEERREYGLRTDDLVGKAGVEKSFDDSLRGQNGGQIMEVDRFGRMVKIIGAESPALGGSLYITLDIELQKLVEGQLDGERGAAVVMDAVDGEILAMASSPGFDPNVFVKSEPERSIPFLGLDDSEGKMLDRCIQCAFPPGSVFKVITSAAGLETECVRAEDTFLCTGSLISGGRTFNCWQHAGHGRMDLPQAIAHSCNVYFFNVGLKLGAENLTRFARLFGLGEPVGVELPWESSGFVPGKKWKKSKQGEGWYEGDTLNFSIGQGYLTVTPMQMMKVVSVFASEGIPIAPHLLKRIEGGPSGFQTRSHLSFRHRFWKYERFPVVSQRTARKIKAGMKETINDPGSTGYRAYLPGLEGAGKTGTATVGNGEPHAWFVGFAPTEKPKVCIVVFLEHGGMGGTRPAEIAREIWKYLLLPKAADGAQTG